MPPLSQDAARELLGSLRSAPLFSGFRGGASYDLDAAAGLLANLASLAGDLDPAIAGIDLNPIIVLPSGQGAMAVDWVVHTEVEQ